MQPTNWSFPQRNRLVAGLSTCVFVPEASLGSGSLITVDYAQQMHRPVYGAPQSIFASTSAGLLSYMQQ
ncbi:DNA-processing protein DprA [Patescibacteria group bacterium]|nr:DNA-processing protein DprA [Patescibacteria group bacterium]